MGILDNIRGQQKQIEKVKIDGFITALKKTFKQLKNRSATAQLIPEQLYRYLWTMQDWRNAVDEAENEHTPNQNDLIEIFNDIKDDYAIFSAMQQRTSKVINTKILFLNTDGSENQEAQEFFLNTDGSQKPWFRKWLKIAQDVKYFGFEVAELGAFINGEFKSIPGHKSVEKIPEQNLIPRFRKIKRNATAGITPDNCIMMDFGKYAPYLVPMGNENDLGALNKAVPYVIWKQIFSNWRQHAEIFGQPFREGRTDIFDNKRVEQMQKMFEEMVGSTYGIFHPDDEVQFIETSKSDAFNIYDKLISRCDYAITKIFLTQTGTTDEKAYVGSSLTHERAFADLIQSDRLDISEYFSELLVPKLKGLGILPPDTNINLTWIIEERLTLTEWSGIIAQLNQNYKVPAEEIKARFNIDVEEREEAPAPEPTPEKLEEIQNKVNQYYKKLWREV